MQRIWIAGAFSLALAACQTPGGVSPSTIAALVAPCSNPKITEHCVTVKVAKNSSGKNVITVSPDPIQLTGHKQFHWFLWTIDDSQSSTPDKYTFASQGVYTTSTQFYSCYRPVWVGSRYYVCYDYNNVPGTIDYEVKLLDAAGNPAPIDPQVFNDG
jgi:hypothetical protein